MSGGARAALWIARAYVLAVLGFIFLPVAVLVTFSFQSGRLPIPPFNGPSLRWYAEVLSDRAMIDALLSSLTVGIAAALTAVTLGFLAAYGVARHALRFKGLIEVAMLVPATVSYLIVGLGLLSFLGTLGIRPSLVSVGIGHAVITLPIAFSLILAQMDPAHVRAENGRARPWRIGIRGDHPRDPADDARPAACRLCDLLFTELGRIHHRLPAYPV